MTSRTRPHKTWFQTHGEIFNSLLVESRRQFIMNKNSSNELDALTARFSDRIAAVTDKKDELRIIYQEYGKRALHHHLLVWTVPGAIIVASAAGLVYLRGADKYILALAGPAFAFLIYTSNKIADANRRQWTMNLAVCNAIEALWGLRDPASKISTHPLIGELDGAESGRNARNRLVLSAIVLCIVFSWLPIFVCFLNFLLHLICPGTQN
jgi:hypothetical protein